MTTHSLNYLGVNMEVEGVYVPSTKTVMYDNNLTGYNGTSHEFAIHSLNVGGQNISELVEESHWEQIERKLLTKYY